MTIAYSPDAPEIIGYFWHRDGSTAAKAISCPREQNRKERIVKLVRDQGTNTLIVFDPDFPLETIAAWCYGGEFAGPLEPPK